VAIEVTILLTNLIKVHDFFFFFFYSNRLCQSKQCVKVWVYDLWHVFVVNPDLKSETSTHFWICPKPGPGFLSAYVMVIFVLNDLK
jgi:hypothetical protein